MSKVEIDTSLIHPRLKHKMEAWLKLCEKAGYNVGVNCGYRSFAEQDKLYAQGRTTQGPIITNAKGGYSQHCFGDAIDFFRNEKGRAFDDSDGWFKKVAALAKKVGLAWGGDWKSFQDKPHLYLPDWGSTTTELRAKYGTYLNFKKTWTAKVDYDSIRVFKSKLTTSKVLTRLTRGAKVNVIYKSKFWWTKIESDNVVGYVKSKYLK